AGVAGGDPGPPPAQTRANRTTTETTAALLREKPTDDHHQHGHGGRGDLEGAMTMAGDDRTTPDSGATGATGTGPAGTGAIGSGTDRKSTRLNSSHVKISYAAFCSRKKTTCTRRPAWSTSRTGPWRRWQTRIAEGTPTPT